MKNLYATLICRSGYVCAAAAAQTLSVLRFVLLSYFLEKWPKQVFWLELMTSKSGAAADEVRGTEAERTPAEA